MWKLLALAAIAAADVARSAVVVAAVLACDGAQASSPWLAPALIAATGLLSLALMGLAMRALLDAAVLRRTDGPALG